MNMTESHLIAEPEAEAIPHDEASMLSIQAKPGRSHVLGGMKNIVRMLIGIRAPDLDTVGESVMPARPPLRVACVLDCSGSMQGQPLEFAKRAVLKLIKHLREGDTLHFITYDSQPEVIFRNGDLSESGKDGLRSLVLSVRSKGQTNLFGGLETAVALLSEQDGDACISQHEVRRIFLFSDGCVNVGVTDQCSIRRSVAEWAEAGITVSTFGIGTHFDEPLMRGIAESGKGRYTYLATAQDIPKLVSKSVHGLLDLFASEAVLDVRGLAHTILLRIYGADDENADAGFNEAAVATPGLLALGDLHHGSERRVLVELEVSPPGDTGEGVCFQAAEWTISFQRQGSLAQFSGKVEQKVTRTRSTWGQECMAVRAAFAIQKAADIDLEVSQHLAQNDRSRARDAKERQLSLLKEMLDALQHTGCAQSDVDALARVLERAERVAAQIARGDNNEMVRRQCIQEMEMNRCMSDADWMSGCDSDDGCDVGNLVDVNSPPGSRSSSNSGSTPSSPRTGAPLSPQVISPISSVGSRSATPHFSTSMDDADWRGGSDSDDGGDAGSLLDVNSPPGSSSGSNSGSIFKPALLFFTPHLYCSDPGLVTQLLPRLQESFDVEHVQLVSDGIQALSNKDFHACVVKGEQGNLGIELIQALRAKPGGTTFIAIHSATIAAQPEMQATLKQEFGVNLCVARGDEDALLNTLRGLATAAAPQSPQNQVPGNEPDEQDASCAIA